MLNIMMIKKNSRYALQLKNFMQLIKKNYSSAPEINYVGLEYKSGYSSDLRINEPGESLPIYRILNENGQLINLNPQAKVDQKTILDMYKTMLSMKELDKILYECQRQGRISFYITHFGEEAVSVGSAAGLKHDDLVFSQYREAGLLHWRGVSLDYLMNQCFGNEQDAGKGKQMPIHYGSKQHSFITVSSPLATQVPQAVGAAYAFKRAKNGRCAVTYFGEGAASEGDVHAGFNFASTLDCPIIFFCRNNGYAISTSTKEQYRGDGIACRASGYGMSAIKVDGNDALAVYDATKLAREYSVQNNKPVLVEALTYRQSHHSTSDDSSAYRPKEEIEEWEMKNPIRRLKSFILNNNWWNEEMEEFHINESRKRVMSSITMAEKLKKPKWQELFHDVYSEMPENLSEQMRYMEDHVSKYKEHYPTESFQS